MDAVEDALVDYALSPERFNSSYGLSVERYLFNAAWRNVVDASKSGTRRRAREERFTQTACLHVDGAGPGIDEMEDKRLERILSSAVATLSDAERHAVRCWLRGADTVSIANALGVGDLPVAERRHEVKRLKDRVIKRCKRTRQADPS